MQHCLAKELFMTMSPLSILNQSNVIIEEIPNFLLQNIAEYRQHIFHVFLYHHQSITHENQDNF